MRLSLEKNSFPREEGQLLLELAGCLGRYDLGGQARALGLYKARLEGLIQESQETLRQRSRAWMAAAVCGGLTLIVVLW
jgi:hypothetical protein